MGTEGLIHLTMRRIARGPAIPQQGNLRPLEHTLNAAVEDGIIATNPAARLGTLATKGRKAAPVEVFAPGVLAFILSEAKRQDPPLYPIVLLLARTGMRIGEALALQARDIDLDGRCIHIKRTWGSRTKANRAERFNSPKGKRDRLVDMSQVAHRGHDATLGPEGFGSGMGVPWQRRRDADAPSDVSGPMDEALESSGDYLPQAACAEVYVCFPADSEGGEPGVCEGPARA
jgi:Phage integrase family